MKAGVLLMAYGSPETPDDVPRYYTHILGGLAPRPEAVEELRERYVAVGGRTPLRAITSRVREALARMLQMPVYVGMKHWHPFIADVVPQIEADGVTDLVAVAMAPHYSRYSIAGYRAVLETSVSALQRRLRLLMIDSWHDAPRFVDCVARRVRDAMESWTPTTRAQVVTLFSAHSLPARIREWDDPYERQLAESCRLVAHRSRVDHWRFAWQSAGQTEEPWLGPDVSDVLVELHGAGARHVLSVPLGFVCDHLEVLYDIDHEARQAADRLGMTFHRARMPNDDPDFVEALAEVVRQALASDGLRTARAGAAS